VNHPTVTRETVVLAIRERLTSAKEESLFRVEDVHVLDASLKALSRTKEEGLLTLTELAGTKLGLASLGINGVHNNAILARGENGHRDLANDLLVDVRDMGLSISESNEPLLTGNALPLTDVTESLNSAQMKSLLVGKNESIDGLNDLLLYLWEIGTYFTVEPLLTSPTGNRVAGKGLGSTKLKGLEGLDDISTDDFDNLDLNARDVSARALEEPLVTSITLHVTIKEISDGSEAESGVWSHDLKGGDFAEKTLARIQWEWILLTTDFLITVTDLVLLEVINDWREILVSLNGVLDDGIMARGDHDHLLRPSDELLVLQAREGLRANLDASHIGIVVQYVDVMKGLDTNH